MFYPTGYDCRKCLNDRAYNYQNKKRLQPGATYEYIERAKVYERDRGKCGICKLDVDDAERSIDHIVPLGRGGSHTYDNVQVAHLKCNDRKGTRG